MQAVTAGAHRVRRAQTEASARRSLTVVFAIVVIAHWLEHVLQAVQIHALGHPPAEALGVLGEAFPALVRSEWLHLAFNVCLLAGLALLLPGFEGAGRRWWRLALAAQCWHLLEHLLLFVQVQWHVRPFGTEAPSSVVQLLVPRVELHLFYNALVTMLMAPAVALSRHRRPSATMVS